ncbi:uncharacterized protein MELLADRAFT_69430 [Melampsora larici-populina 98AG31]|uniref:Uncharacterized protein n=1 Tax=Melampsora larici-populina (strain 98AG31 / pathotype 3-4-7) TaxID=747676 RepID=F4SAQ5_MELLP|nr:uncharacterized protein MELLADRAFT_69430 [Melampsora larici-populina 98AG31]EGF98257.1 hypothetical protein MELLADRAFT_69430 [Melampsora larici-populina 98AG31]
MSSVGSKRDLETAGFAELASGSTSQTVHQDGSEVNKMKATLLEAGFDIDKGQKSEKDMIILYNRYVLQKQIKQPTQSREIHQKSRSSRHSQTKHSDQDNVDSAGTCAKTSLTVPSGSNQFTFEADKMTSNVFESNGDQLDPSTGPLRTRRSSARLSNRNSEVKGLETKTKQGKRLSGPLGPRHAVPRSARCKETDIPENEKSLPSVGSKTTPANLDKASKKSDEDPASPAYCPPDEAESDDDFVKTNQPPLNGKAPSEKGKTLRRRMRHRKFQLNSSDSENNSAEKTHSSLPSGQQSSEDTSDLHETSNFRTSPILTRATTGSILFPDSEDDEENEPVSFPVLKRRKGKSRAKNQEHPSEDEEFFGQKSMLGGDCLSSNDGSPIVNEIEEEWDAGNLFGEGVGSPGTKSNSQSNKDNAHQTRQESQSRSLLGLEHFRSELVDLRSLCTDNAQQIASLSNKFDVFADLLRESLKQREPTRSTEREPGGEAFGDLTADDSPSQPARASRMRVSLLVSESRFFQR